MLSKKILGLLIAASALAPLTTAIVEAIDPECVQATTEFIASDTPLNVNSAMCLYGMPPATGDVNRDSKINISDYTVLKKYIDSDDNTMKIDKFNADLNRDGEISFLDLLLLKDYI